ncbi:hypothetical protein [Pusillimonas sp. ANT_WB101]|uniref:phage tail termination protein n=1 Tax=Pusillimonas sp. ANT_WB101 TaxID=2597356 RepID=UPI0011EFC11C|nr:hypothetical protein [Pusillimonas sp. ANT_WB101]KAA0910683.1 hypothetical protein FQ179_02060 [Pusillimonas sp. ANT_WB101]
MLDDVKAWIQAIIGSGYAYSMGMWVDNASNSASKICSIQAGGGSPPVVDTRHQRIRVVLLGGREQTPGGASDKATIMTDANALVRATLNGPVPCGTATINTISEPIGPGYTTESRPWVEVSFEILF